MAKLIALDLDGTLLNSKKEVSAENRKALEWATSQGAIIVPTTGRFFGAMPQVVRELPFLRYAITVNGAQAYDILAEKVLYRGELSPEKAVELMVFLDDYPVIYDAYIDSWGWMTKTMQDSVADVIREPYFIQMVRDFRSPVPDLKEYVKNRGEAVQKIQFFTEDQNLRQEIFVRLAERFDGLSVTYATPFNAELNDQSANKGKALLHLADCLGIDQKDTIAMGDGLNDLSMILASGVGVAMGNAIEQVKTAADYVTATNDEDGVAKAIYRFCQ